MQDRIDWVDQVKGLAIFLVVYGHNFPVTEKYIYSFHMPLFFMVSGFFFPAQLDFSALKKRVNSILIPYFLWAAVLFLIWVLIGRRMGNSASKGLSVTDNFIGIFYAQGGGTYMDWGIPMWFLPTIFLCFLFYFIIRKYVGNAVLRNVAVLSLTSAGFLYTRLTDTNLPWSVHVALVALFFFAFGNLVFRQLDKIPKTWSLVLIPVFISLHFALYDQNEKIDMYRAIYGNEFLFLLNALLGSMFILLLLKNFPRFKVLSLIGKFTLVILALQILAMSFIKLVLWIGFGQVDFQFSEMEKFLYSFVQILLIYPVFLVINKYFPILNGGYKKI